MKTLKSVLAVFLFITVFASCRKDQIEPANQDLNAIAEQTTDPGQTPGVNEKDLGCNLLPPSEYAKLPKMQDQLSVQTLPVTYTLLTPAIGNQGGEGSCVGWGTAYAARSIYYKVANGQSSYANNVNVFSPEYVYNQVKINSSCTSGAYVSTALNLLKNKGVCTWAQMNYSSTNGCSLMPTTKQNTAAALYKINGWGTVSRTVSNFKNLLYTNKPIIVAGPVDSNFDFLGYNQVLTQYNSATYRGGHCYAVVGYDDNRQAFKVMNSWGTSWATGGYGWISYNMITTSFTEAYIIY